MTHMPSSDSCPAALQNSGFRNLLYSQLNDGMSIPAKPGVYVFSSIDSATVLLAATADLRAAVLRRLRPAAKLMHPTPTTPASLVDGPPPGDDAPAASTGGPQVDYAALTHSISYCCVGSGFWGNWVYSLAARSLFPQSFNKMLGWKPAWYISIHPQAEAPFFHIGTKIPPEPAVTFGPIGGRANAQRLVHELSDIFDLCRYEDILRQSPRGRACAYKDMGQCPAPCDGTVPMPQYLASVHAAINFLVQWNADPHQEPHSTARRTLEGQMRSAAAQLEYRQAGKFRDKLKKLDDLSLAGLNHLAPIAQWGYLMLQPGKTSRWIEPFVMSGRGIWRLAQVRAAEYLADGAFICHQWLRAAADCFSANACGQQTAIDAMNAVVQPKPKAQAVAENTAAEFSPVPNPEDIVSLVCYHLFRTRDPGLYIPRQKLTDVNDLDAQIRHWLEREKSSGHRAGGVLEQSSRTDSELAEPKMDPPSTPRPE